MNWDTHINNITSKTNKIIGFCSYAVQELAIEDGQALPKHCWYCDNGLSRILPLCAELVLIYF
jgi:hypothetical protein